MFAVLWTMGSLDYAVVSSLAPYLNSDLITIIGLCFLIGAMAKSAQLGLHVWLPLAMEGGGYYSYFISLCGAKPLLAYIIILINSKMPANAVFNMGIYQQAKF